MSYIFEPQYSPFSKQAIGIGNVESAQDGSHLLYHVDDLPEVRYGFSYLLFWYNISNNPLSQRGWPKWPKFDTQPFRYIFSDGNFVFWFEFFKIYS